MTFERFIAGRYLKVRQQHSFISLTTLLCIAGVATGVMALIVVIAVMAGFKDDLKKRILGVESHLVVMRHGESFTQYPEALNTIRQTDGILGATPVIYDQVMLRSAANVSGAMVRGIDPESVAGVVTLLEDIDLGGLQSEGSENNTPGIILGKELASSLGVVPKDSVYLIAPRGVLSPMGHMPSMRRFRVAGIFEAGMYEYDGSLAYVDLAVAQKLFKMNSAVSGIEIRLADVDSASDVARVLTEKLGFPYWTRTWMQLNRNLFSALKLEKTVMFIILALIILVAAFNITSSLIMMVMEKTHDIAILKAMGATNGSIRKIFVLKGMAIGAIGTALGVVLGYALCFLLKHYQFIELPGDVYYLSTLPVALNTTDVIAIAFSALAICFLATLYPSGQAAKLDPVEAVRYGG